MKNKISKFSIFAAVLAAGLVSTSCRSDDGGGSGTSGNVKYTVTINGVEGYDDVLISLAGGTDTEVYNQWKVNGVVKSGEGAIGLSDDDFKGATKTYIMESSKPLTHISSGVSVVNFGVPLDVSIKIEKDGKVVAQESKTLSGEGTSFVKQYTF